MERLLIQYYPDRTAGPVKDFIDEQAWRNEKALFKLRRDLEVLSVEGLRSHRISIRPLGGGLWELKRLYGGIQYRIFFCVSEGEIWLLHAIEKKSSKTPLSDLRLAHERMKEKLT